MRNMYKCDLCQNFVVEHSSADRGFPCEIATYCFPENPLWKFFQQEDCRCTTIKYKDLCPDCHRAFAIALFEVIEKRIKT